MTGPQYIAVDLGAESGRVMLGTVANGRLQMDEVHRFQTGPIEQAGSLRWDFTYLLSEVKKGIAKATRKAENSPAGIGFDTWGVDFGLLDKNGELIENPFHYRDARTNNMMQEAFKRISKREIYEHTGLQFMQFNTIYQLLAMKLSNSQALARADKLIFMADLFAYFLSGRPFAEYTLASTSQLMNMKTGQWAPEIFERLDLPMNIMPEVIKPGTIAGKLSEKVADELNCPPIPLMAVGSHDTASAVAAVPATTDKWAYLSSGTWSLCGVEVQDAIINAKTFECPFTNEGGVENTIRLLKNIMGLWLVQECRRQWQREGNDLSYAQLTAMAQDAKPFQAVLDPDHEDFIAPGNMPERINAYLQRTGQSAVQDKGQIVRIILESLALKSKWVIQKLEDVTGEEIECLHIVGGGIRNELLSQFTADAVGKPVIAGPVEATAIGNLLMQARAAGRIQSLQQLRQIVSNSFQPKRYEPQQRQQWQKQYAKAGWK